MNVSVLVIDEYIENKWNKETASNAKLTQAHLFYASGAIGLGYRLRELEYTNYDLKCTKLQFKTEIKCNIISLHIWIIRFNL